MRRTVEEEEEEEADEVEELDSLGQLHNELADATSSQDNTGTSKPAEQEVTPNASESETVAPRRTRLAVKKVPFSHPLAHLDPFLPLKMQQHAESKKRKLRSSGSDDLHEGLSSEPSPRRTRRQEQLSPTSSCPRAGLLKAPLDPLDPAYHESSPSSGASSTS